MNQIAQVFATITLAAWLMPSINGAAINKLDGTCICTREFQPICGSDGATYFNNCLFNCATGNDPKLQFHHNGACRKELDIESIDDICICTHEYMPLCGSDGETHSNECLFECRRKKITNLKIMHEGECNGASKKSEGCKCSREYLPICATDDQTYDNECHLNCQRKQTPELDIQFRGQCDKFEQLEMSPNQGDDCICTRIFDPVCGSDGETYLNVCRFTCQQNKYSNLKIVHRGECKAVESKTKCICTREYNPVCGSNGKTYSNECEFNCEHRIDDTLELESKGPCEFAVLY